jgi:hypothetical protein
LEISNKVAIEVGDPARDFFEQGTRRPLIEAVTQHDVGVVMTFDVTKGRKQIDALRLFVGRRELRLRSQ